MLVGTPATDVSGDKDAQSAAPLGTICLGPCACTLACLASSALSDFPWTSV